MSTLSEKVQTGSACQFCERAFVDEKGQPFLHHKLTVCGSCWNLISKHGLAKNQASVPTKEGAAVWALRTSDILREIQSEVESDFTALVMER